MGFNQATRELWQTRPTLGYRNAGLVVQELPQSHLLSDIILKGVVTITDASDLDPITNGYNVDYGAPPFSIVRRVRVRNNIGANLIDCSAWSLYLHNLTERSGFDAALNDPDGFRHTGASADPFVRYFVGTGTDAAIVTLTTRFGIKCPIALGSQNITGLQNLSNPAVRYTLEIEWGAPTDLMSGDTAAAIASDTGGTITPTLHMFTIPSRPDDYPHFGATRLIQEERQGITVTGDQTYRPTPGPNYLKWIFEPIFNSEPVPCANITNIRSRYAQAQEYLRIDPDTKFWLQRWAYGKDLPEGVVCLDYLLGNGIPEMPSSRDVIDSSRITDLEHILTTDATVTGSCYIRVLKDMLAPSI